MKKYSVSFPKDSFKSLLDKEGQLKSQEFPCMEIGEYELLIYKLLNSKKMYKMASELWLYLKRDLKDFTLKGEVHHIWTWYTDYNDGFTFIYYIDDTYKTKYTVQIRYSKRYEKFYISEVGLGTQIENEN